MKCTAQTDIWRVEKAHRKKAHDVKYVGKVITPPKHSVLPAQDGDKQDKHTHQTCSMTTPTCTATDTFEFSSHIHTYKMKLFLMLHVHVKMI